MRISTHMLQQTALRGIDRSLQTLAQAQEQATTGKRVNTVSDDPVDASQIMRMNGALRDIDQFQRNATAASTRLSTEDVVLTHARDLVKQAQSVAASAASAAVGSDERNAAVTELQQIHDQLVSLGNTQVGDEYIFGGSQSTNAPFQANGAYVGDSVTRQAQVDSQIALPTNHTGDQLFAPALSAIQTLTSQLQTGTQAQVDQTVATLDTTGRQMLTLQTDEGARLADIQAASQSLVSRTNTITDQVQSMQDVDPANALVNVLNAQQALERAYAVIGRVLQSSVLDQIP